MRIESVEPIAVDRYLFVEVRTDTGIVGLGEASAWAHHAETAEAIRSMGEVLAGTDPRMIERHWQFLHRAAHFRGAVLGFTYAKPELLQGMYFIPTFLAPLLMASEVVLFGLLIRRTATMKLAAAA